MSRDIEWSLETIMFALIFVCNNDIVSRYFEIKIVFFHINRKEQSQSKSEHINKTLEKPKCQPRIDNPEKLATLGTQDTRRRQTHQKTQHNMCWTPPYTKRRQTNKYTLHIVSCTTDVSHKIIKQKDIALLKQLPSRYSIHIPTNSKNKLLNIIFYIKMLSLHKVNKLPRYQSGQRI
jgi:hypothetical protein